MLDLRDSQKGFTLLELLVALTIFAIGLLSIAGMQITAIQSNSKSNTLGVRAALAQRVMEDISSKDPSDPFFDAAVPNAVFDLEPDDNTETSLTLEGAGTYSARYTVTIDDPVTNVTRIVVTVTGPSNRTSTLTTFKRSL
jgi:type IV pilus assembly protein PilV